LFFEFFEAFDRLLRLVFNLLLAEEHILSFGLFENRYFFAKSSDVESCVEHLLLKNQWVSDVESFHDDRILLLGVNARVQTLLPLLQGQYTIIVLIN
jgi:hypothetical protein